MGCYMLLFVKHSRVCRAFVVLPLPNGPLRLIKSPKLISWQTDRIGDNALSLILLTYCFNSHCMARLGYTSLTYAIASKLISYILLACTFESMIICLGSLTSDILSVSILSTLLYMPMTVMAY